MSPTWHEGIGVIEFQEQAICTLPKPLQSRVPLSPCPSVTEPVPLAGKFVPPDYARSCKPRMCQAEPVGIQGAGQVLGGHRGVPLVLLGAEGTASPQLV